ncbi:MAG: SDR family NAD(P)-dependent oxidoreductase [Pseudomonadota bacterium]|nr:SDR family NAD(P)-dependent oxidoreductase [Pseudomonadota bacterium]
MKLAGKVVAITGAGSGIGRALAEQGAREGARLALSDIDETALAETAEKCRAHGAEVFVQPLDVSNSDAIYAWADSVVEHFGSVNVIINNAGVALSASVEGTTIEDFKWLMDIDFWSVVHGCKAFLPYLKKADWGHVVNVSSLFGLIGVPNQCAYNSAKFAVRGFTESLRMELKLENSSVGVSCVHPGGVKTNIANSGRHGIQVATDASFEEQKRKFNEELAKTTPEKAAQIIFDGIRKNTGRVLVGKDAKFLDMVQRLLPSSYQKAVMAFMGGSK